MSWRNMEIKITRLVLILAGVLVQTSVLTIIFPPGKTPNIILLIIIAWTIVAGFEKIWPWAITAGIIADLAFFDPLEVDISGIIQIEDIELIAEALADNTTAALLLFENLWAIKFGEAVTRSSGKMVMYDRIPFEVVNEMLEIFAQAEA